MSVNRCGDCDYLNYRDCKYGEYWCNRRREYTKSNDRACSYYTYKNHNYGSDCYLTTAMCDILGYEDNCYFLETLRKFRDNFMKKDHKYDDLLKEYKDIGPKICDKLYKDKDREQITLTMKNFYILPAINAINNYYYDSAINIYVDMTNNLKEKYLICDIKDKNSNLVRIKK